MPVQLGAQVPHTVSTGGKQVVPLAQVAAHSPPQPSDPPHLPLQLGVQTPPSLDTPGDWTAEPDSAVYEEHAADTMAATTGARECLTFIEAHLQRFKAAVG